MGACALDASSVPAVPQDALNDLATAMELHVGSFMCLLLCDQAFWGINKTTKASYGKKAT